MTQEVAYRFIEALNALEQDGEIDPMLSIFSEYCEIGTPVIPNKLQGRDQAREFWSSYRTAHRRIHSRFRNIVIGENSIALEWTASGTHRSGREFQYDGVSVLEIGGLRITRLRTYFDSRAVQEQAPLSAAAF